MGKTFVWSCTHKLCRDNLNGASVTFDYKCYVCKCAKKIKRVHETVCDMYDKLEETAQLDGDEVVDREMNEINDYRQKQFDKMYYEYGKDSQEVVGEKIIEALAGLNHEKMMYGLTDQSGQQLIPRKR